MFTTQSTILRYTCFGVLFGATFPVISYCVDRFMVHQKPIGIFETFAYNPVQSIVALAPFVLGAVFAMIGSKQEKLQSQLTKTLEVRESYWTLANRDSLTGHGNRHKLVSDIREILADGTHIQFSLLLVDLDKFKFINDTLGHNVGDELLVAFAQRATEVMQENDRLYRIGGDEFVVICDMRSGSQRLQNLADKIVQALNTPFAVGGTQVVAGGSIGMTNFTADDENEIAALSRADLALYEAKARYGNCSVEFKDDFAEAASQRLHMEQDLQRAIENDEFYLEFQPIIGVETSKVRGFEALVRWQHPTRGLVTPDSFIPFAEVSGLIGKIGSHVLKLACHEAKKWPSPLSVSVNVSVEEFKNRNFYEQVMDALGDAQLPSGRLILEITESVFTYDMDVMRDTFNKLKGAGVRFALDDFGTGYSSINHLRQLDLDYLKLDRSFVENLTEDSRETALVRNVIELGKMFKLTTTIEGIETDEQLEILRNQGVNEAQGFLISHPISAADIPALLNDMDGTNAIRKVS